MAVLNKLSVPRADGSENQGTIMPKLAYRFRVSFILDSGETHVVSNNVISVTRPNVTHEEVVVDTYNSKVYLAGKHSWEPVTIELRDDIDSATSKILDAQLAKQIDMANQSSPRAGASYKFTVDIENLNGANPDPETLDTWTLQGCFIQNISYSDTNYASGGEYQSITVQLRFDNAEHVVDGKDYLSDPSFSTDTDSISGAN